MSRQFKSDDTSKWLEGFGRGTEGAVTISSNLTTGGGNLGIHYGTLTGTSGQYTATVPSGFSWLNKPCLIHQTQGTGAGNWELNVQTISNGTTATFKYPLQNTYGTGAQIVTANEYNNLTINSGVTVTASAWNGSIGGIVLIFDKGLTTITGTITATGKGFRGGASPGWSGTDRYSYQGEGASGTGGLSNLANVGGGGGGWGNSGSSNGGGGGGHGAAGTTGEAAGETPGTGGTADGNASLTDMVFGGGGGCGGQSDEGNNPGAGGIGGGTVFLISKNIILSGVIVSGGNNGGNASGGVVDGGGGGGGAGGSVLIKCQTGTLGTNKITASAGSGGISTGPGGDGGAGGVGRIHLDYSVSYSGSTTPAIDVSQDLTIQPASTGGSFLFHFV